MLINKQTCPNCHKSAPSPPNNSIFSAPFCYDCIIATAKLQHPEGVQNANTFDRLCQSLNIAFYADEWNKTLARTDTPLKALQEYFHFYGANHMPKVDWAIMQKKHKKAMENGLLDLEITQYHPAKFAELRLIWGDTHGDNDLIRLETLYNAFLRDFNLELESQRDKAKKITRLSLMIDNLLSQGKVNKDITTQYESLLNSLMKEVELTDNDGIDSVSKLVERIEQSGFLPTFQPELPQDDYDFLLEDMRAFLVDLVKSSVDLNVLFNRVAEKYNYEFVDVKVKDEGKRQEWQRELAGNVDKKI